MGKSHWHCPTGDAAYSTLIIFYALIFSVTGITLSPCYFDDTVELQDTRSQNTVTCSDIPDDFVVDWLLVLPSRPGPVNVGTCNVGSTTCSDLSPIGYLATRPSANTSVMTINPTTNVNFVRNGTLECKASKAGQQNQVDSCRLDIITPSTNVACSVRPQDNALNVIGSCNVSKVYSYHGRYSCQWYRKNESKAEEAVGQPVAMQTALTADVTPSNGIYVDGFCDIIMPSPSVNTSYRAVIYPGDRSEGAGFIYRDKTTSDSDCCRLYLLLLLLLLLLPIPIPPPWPGYPIYVVLCRIPNQSSSTDSPRPGWHTHYMCGRRTNNVYFSALFVTNDGRTILIWSRSPTTGRFVWYGTEITPNTNRNNVSAESGAVNNGNKHSSQKEKNKHVGTDGSPRKSKHPEAPVELTPVRTSSPPQAATVHGDNQASGTPHGDHQASGTPRLRPLPEPSRMTSVERNSTAETSNMLGRDKHPKLPPIRKPDNQP